MTMPAGPSSYDLIAEIYDFDMGANIDGDDINFYRRQCAGVAGPVLELGCGTGRITIPLAASGVRVVGVDLSVPMLRVLRRKADQELSSDKRRLLDICAMDMRFPALCTRFSRIICAYSVFTYAVDIPDRDRVLNFILNHLAPGGEFILDVFIPDAGVMALPDDHVFHDYRRLLPDGTVLERTKTIAKDAAHRVNVINRRYVFSDPRTGARTRVVETSERIRYYYPREMEEVLARSGFEVLAIQGDFQGGSCGPGSRMAVFRSRIPT